MEHKIKNKKSLFSWVGAGCRQTIEYQHWNTNCPLCVDHNQDLDHALPTLDLSDYSDPRIPNIKIKVPKITKKTNLQKFQKCRAMRPGPC